MTRPPERSNRRSLRIRALLVVSGVLLAVLGLSSAPAGAEAAWLAGCGPKQTGTVRVALVVDFGTEPDAPQGIEVACVVVPEGSKGDTVLVTWARSRQQGIRTKNGLVCGIAGYPATGCGEQTETGYLYWSYWYDGPAGWTYGSIGPAARPVCDGSVEGWHFVRGSGRPDDPPPRVPIPTVTGCSAPTAPSTTSTALPAEPVPATGTPAPAGASPFLPSSPPPTPSLPAPTGNAVVPSTVPAMLDGGGLAPDVPTDADADAADLLDTTEAASAERSRTGGERAVGVDPPAEVALTQASLSTDSSGSSALPTLVGVGLIAGLAAVARVRFRRGSPT